MIKIDNCPLCNTPTIDNTIITRNVRFSTQKNMVVQCINCDLFYKTTYMDRDKQREVFTNFFSTKMLDSYDNEVVSAEMSHSDIEKRKGSMDYVTFIIENIPNNSSVLIIGAGSGVHGQALKFTDCMVDMVEPSKFYVDYLKDKFDTIYEDLFEEANISKTYDYIILPDSLEYFPNPLEIVDKIYNLVNKQVYIITKFHNKETNDFQMLKPCYYNLNALVLLFSDFKTIEYASIKDMNKMLVRITKNE
jgi:hypothetical protein